MKTPYDARIAEIKAIHPSKRLLSMQGDLEENLLRREGYLECYVATKPNREALANLLIGNVPVYFINPKAAYKVADIILAHFWPEETKEEK